jgi:hypothetical protein
VSYRPGPYPGPLTYFRTSAADRARPADDAPAFWSALAGGGAEVVTVGGSHGTLLQHPFVGEVAAGLSRALASQARQPLARAAAQGEERE